MQLTEEQFEALSEWVEAVAEFKAAGHLAGDYEWMVMDKAKENFRLSVGLPKYRD